jgi:hypothetical protein
MRFYLVSQLTLTCLLHLQKFKVNEPRSFEDEDTFLRNFGEVRRVKDQRGSISRK